ncbi:MAG TPA: hypothetical protein VEJ21_05065 [Acidimicrobiales bacterium]|nr:hypothetical protein [Acidimicrobiales bacterium]
MGTIVIRSEIIDGALVVVVDPSRRSLAVWKGRNRIDLHDPSGRWHESVSLLPLDTHESWDRQAAITSASQALESTEPPALPEGDPASQDAVVRVDVDALQASWLARAKPWAFALWDGGETVDVFNADGARRRAVTVPPADLSTLSHLMLDLLALTRREDDVTTPQH